MHGYTISALSRMSIWMLMETGPPSSQSSCFQWMRRCLSFMPNHLTWRSAHQLRDMTSSSSQTNATTSSKAQLMKLSVPEPAGTSAVHTYVTTSLGLYLLDLSSSRAVAPYQRRWRTRIPRIHLMLSSYRISMCRRVGIAALASLHYHCWFPLLKQLAMDSEND
jgi:hypothetical protein